MEILNLGRAGGKTHHMIGLLLRSGNYLLITPNELRANQIRNTLEGEYRKRVPMTCWTHDHFPQAIRSLRNQVVVAGQEQEWGQRVRANPRLMLLVDDFDLVLNQIFGKVPTSVTMTEPVRLTYELPSLSGSQPRPGPCMDPNCMNDSDHAPHP